MEFNFCHTEICFSDVLFSFSCLTPGFQLSKQFFVRLLFFRQIICDLFNFIKNKSAILQSKHHLPVHDITCLFCLSSKTIISKNSEIFLKIFYLFKEFCILFALFFNLLLVFPDKLFVLF